MQAEIVLNGLCFGEGPRWHDGALWFSDMHDHKVLRLSKDRGLECVVEIPNRPSGLGWRPDGTLLIVSMLDRRLMAWQDGTLSEVADLSNLAGFHLNDMVVDQTGRAYIGNFGFDLNKGAEFRSAELICVDTRGSASVLARDLAFPNGSVITPDDGLFIVAETFAGRLTAFDKAADGTLSNPREWASLPEGAVPDGICLDERMGIWVASPTTNECLRLERTGAVSHRVALSQSAFACMLGGEDGRTLFMLTANSSDPDICRAERKGRIETLQAPYAHAGRP